ncbi:hypothetical protein GCM10025857_31470 [Alicyclobacillus contaminans]|nr:hypothetical protein GCM10025857_31470 [Alicyclobacillus contaminans]
MVPPLQAQRLITLDSRIDEYHFWSSAPRLLLIPGYPFFLFLTPLTLRDGCTLILDAERAPLPYTAHDELPIGLRAPFRRPTLKT